MSDHASPGHNPPPGRQAPKQTGMSSTMKTVLIVSAIGGFIALLCCGGGLYMANQFEFDVQEDPQLASEVTDEIAQMDIPERFEPAGTLRMDMFVMDMTMAIWEATGVDGQLVVAETDISFGNQEDVEPELRDAMEQAGVDDDEEMRIVSTEVRDFDIRGESVAFQFAEAEERTTDARYRRISGAFPATDGGAAFVWVEIEEDHYDEDSLVRMLESIQ